MEVVSDVFVVVSFKGVLAFVSSTAEAIDAQRTTARTFQYEDQRLASCTEANLFVPCPTVYPKHIAVRIYVVGMVEGNDACSKVAIV